MTNSSAMLWVSLAVSECCVVVCNYICAHWNIITPQAILRNVFGKQFFLELYILKEWGSLNICCTQTLHFKRFWFYIVSEHELICKLKARIYLWHIGQAWEVFEMERVIIRYVHPTWWYMDHLFLKLPKKSKKLSTLSHQLS